MSCRRAGENLFIEQLFRQHGSRGTHQWQCDRPNPKNIDRFVDCWGV
jgi:hypothetical protein